MEALGTRRHGRTRFSLVRTPPVDLRAHSPDCWSCGGSVAVGAGDSSLPAFPECCQGLGVALEIGVELENALDSIRLLVIGRPSLRSRRRKWPLLTYPLYISQIHEIRAISPTNTLCTFQANRKAGNAPRLRHKRTLPYSRIPLLPYNFPAPIALFLTIVSDRRRACHVRGVLRCVEEPP